MMSNSRKGGRPRIEEYDIALERIAILYKDGYGYPRIAKRIREEFDLNISISTVRRKVIELGILETE